VKKHVFTVWRKRGVRTHLQAVACARALRLVDQLIDYADCAQEINRRPWVRSHIPKYGAPRRGEST
jgi:hypothetical protein